MNNLSAQADTDRSLHTYFWWATTVAWAALIYYLSSGTYGWGFTAWLLREVLNFLHIEVTGATFTLLHNSIRKLAHLTEYMMLALLLYGSLSAGRDFSWRPRPALICLAMAAVYSLTDEFHQWFVPGRGASLVDCGIDTSGAVLGVTLIYLRNRLFPAKAHS